MRLSLKIYSFITSIFVLLAVVGGALVTKTESGLGCGRSWPLCHGKIIPDNITVETFIELSHRIVSSSSGILLLILAIWAWRSVGHIREVKALSIISFGFLVLQGLFGAAAVVWGQNPFVRALHFGVSLISFAAVFLLTALIYEIDKKFEAHKLVLDKRMKFHIYGVTIYSFIVVYTGALVRHVNATFSCMSFPFCTKEQLIGQSLPQFVQMSHRFAASLILVWLIYATFVAYKRYRHQRVVTYGLTTATILVVLQASAGMGIVLTKSTLYIPLLHSVIITLLFGLLTYLCLLGTRSKKNAQQLTNNQSTKNPHLHL
ncbi:MAG: heme A synthase [Bacillaceae bacterium]